MLKQGQHIKTTVDAWLDFEEIIFYLIFFLLMYRNFSSYSLWYSSQLERICIVYIGKQILL